MSNYEILKSKLSPISNSCKIWDEFLNFTQCYNLYWSQNSILLNHNFIGEELLYISTSGTAPESLYNAMQNLNTYYNTYLWNFKIVDICELTLEGEEEYFLKKVADAVYNDNNEELNRLGAIYQEGNNQNNNEGNINKYLKAPSYNEIVERLKKLSNEELSKQLIGRNFITKVELDNTDITENGIKNTVYILFSFVDDGYFNRIGLNSSLINK